MNVKNIIKVVALAMLMPAMMLNSACSNEDEPIFDNENAPTRGYPLYVSVNATRQGDAGTNRASFDGTYLNFTAGDKLFVTGVHVGGVDNKFAGLLDYDDVSGKFSGTIYTQYSYPGTAQELFEATMTSVTAYLIPNGYGKYFDLGNYYGDSYNDNITFDYHYAFADTKKLAVEQLSYEHGGYDKINKRFVLNPFNAILNFTVTGLAASTEVEVVFNDGTTEYNKRMSTNASGTATFAIGVPGYVESFSAGTNLNTCTLSVGGNAITLVSSSKVLTAGKIYNITRNATPALPALNITNPSVGQVIGSDGKNYADADAASLAGATAVAKICYVSGSNDLALALTDEGELDWSTAIETCAAHTPAFTGGTWKLASQDEWNNMITAVGSHTDLRDGFSSVGGTNMEENCYWSSTEYDSFFAWYYDDYDQEDWDHDVKECNFYVRACLAF